MNIDWNSSVKGTLFIPLMESVVQIHRHHSSESIGSIMVHRTFDIRPIDTVCTWFRTKLWRNRDHHRPDLNEKAACMFLDVQ